jgi:hypothetical protein
MDFGGGAGEVQRLSEELMSARTKLASWEDCWVQAKQACDAWKKEAEDSIKKAKNSHHDKLEALLKLSEVGFSFVVVAVAFYYLYN